MPRAVFQIADPEGILDAIATLEHIRDDANFRIAALRSNLAVAAASKPLGHHVGPDCKFSRCKTCDDGADVCAVCGEHYRKAGPR